MLAGIHWSMVQLPESKSVESRMLQCASTNGEIWLTIWPHNAKHVSNVVKYPAKTWNTWWNCRSMNNVDKCAVLVSDEMLLKLNLCWELPLVNPLKWGYPHNGDHLHWPVRKGCSRHCNGFLSVWGYTLQKSVRVQTETLLLQSFPYGMLAAASLWLALWKLLSTAERKKWWLSPEQSKTCRQPQLNRFRHADATNKIKER